MLKGQVFKNEIFENQIFAVFIDTFLNGTNGVIANYKNGMEIGYTTDNVTIDTGTLVIQGRFLEEDTSTTLAVSKNTAYNKLIIEINLDLENTDNNFVQAQYKILSSTNDYPALTQTDIVKNNAGIYQYELARFTTDISGIRSFEDKRTFVDYNSIYAMIQEMIENIESGSIYALKTDLDSLQETLEGEMESLQQQISTNVQGQIDTLSEDMSTLQNNVNTQISTTNTNVDKKTIYSDFVLENYNFSISVYGGNTNWQEFTKSKSGYYPIAIACDRATGQAPNTNYTGAYRGSFITSQASGQVKYVVGVSGTTSEAASFGITGDVKILWVRIR